MVLDHKYYIHNLQDLTLVKSVETCYNTKGRKFDFFKEINSFTFSASNDYSFKINLKLAKHNMNSLESIYRMINDSILKELEPGEKGGIMD